MGEQETARLPRILIVNGESINSTSPTGITLGTIFAGFPKENLLELSLVEGDAPAKVESHTLSGSTEVFRHLGRRLTGGNAVSRQVNDRIRRSEVAEDAEAYDSLMTFKQVVNAYLDIGPVRPDRDLVQRARDFRPDIVYTAGSTVTILRLASLFARECECPMLLHYLDNWRESLHAGRFTWLPRRILRRRIAEIERSSAVALTISDKMTEAYTNKAGVRFVPVMNAVDTSRAAQPPRDVGPDGVNFVYAGGLHLRRYTSLLAVEQAVKAARHDGLSCRLTIYTSENHAHVHGMFDPDVTTFMPAVTHAGVHDVYASADVLVHGESFDESLLPFIRYSISTKISEYMASGRPILCFAPGETALHSYVRENRVGLAPTSIDELTVDVRRLVSDRNLRDELATNGVTVARARHSYEAAHRTIVDAVSANLAPSAALGQAPESKGDH